MGAIIDARRTYASERLDKLAAELTTAETIIGDKACVYITGSGARGELTQHSDLDLFIVSDVEVRREKRPPGEDAKPRLRRLDSIVVKAELIRATKKLEFPPFSGDGRYLEAYTTEELTENLGRAEDDHSNTFTARLLLLLESRPLLGATFYKQVIDDVIAPYWRDYDERQDSFRPVFLMNDILRLWKTFCVNYEAYTEQQPDEKRAKRKLKNYKLKHSRVLTCYTALLYLMQTFAEKGTVHPNDVREMVSQSPTQRLEWIAGRPNFAHVETISKILASYERFLERTNKKEEELVSLFMDKGRAKEFTNDAHQIGDTVSDLLKKMGPGNALYRYLIV